jgi:hypothetical protein
MVTLNKPVDQKFNILSKKQKWFYISAGILIACLGAIIFYMGMNFIEHFVEALIYYVWDNIYGKYYDGVIFIDTLVTRIIFAIITCIYIVFIIFFKKQSKNNQKYKYILRGFIWTVPIICLGYYFWFIIMFALFLDSAFGNH